MSVSEALVVLDPKRMTWAEICAAYVGQWVLLTDLELIDESELEIRSAVVAAHSIDRHQTYRLTVGVPDGSTTAHFFIDEYSYLT